MKVRAVKEIRKTLKTEWSSLAGLFELSCGHPRDTGVFGIAFHPYSSHGRVISSYGGDFEMDG